MEKTFKVNENDYICGKLYKIHDCHMLNGIMDDISEFELFKSERASSFGLQISTSDYFNNKKFSNSCFISRNGLNVIFIERIILAKSIVNRDYNKCFLIAKKYDITELNYFKYKFDLSHTEIPININEFYQNYLAAIKYDNVIVKIAKLNIFKLFI